MGIKIGDVDVANEIVNLNYQLLRTQLLLDHVLKSIAGSSISSDTIRQIDDQAIQQIQTKFPSMGISKIS